VGSREGSQLGTWGASSAPTAGFGAAARRKTILLLSQRIRTPLENSKHWRCNPELTLGGGGGGLENPQDPLATGLTRVVTAL